MTYSDLLRNPDRIVDVSWRELHDWVQQYPYVQGLRLLAVRKAKLENNADLQPLLELAATYSPNRRYLYDFLQQPQKIFEEPANIEELEDNTASTGAIEQINTETLPEIDRNKIATASNEEEDNIPLPATPESLEDTIITTNEEEMKENFSTQDADNTNSNISSPAIEDDLIEQGEVAPKTERNDTEESAEPIIEVVVATKQVDSEKPQNNSVIIENIEPAKSIEDNLSQDSSDFQEQENHVTDEISDNIATVEKTETTNQEFAPSYTEEQPQIIQDAEEQNTPPTAVIPEEVAEEAPEETIIEEIINQEFADAADEEEIVSAAEIAEEAPEEETIEEIINQEFGAVAAADDDDEEEIFSTAEIAEETLEEMIIEETINQEFATAAVEEEEEEIFSAAEKEHDNELTNPIEEEEDLDIWATEAVNDDDAETDIMEEPSSDIPEDINAAIDTEEEDTSFADWLSILNGDPVATDEPVKVQTKIYDLDDDEDESLEDIAAEEDVRRLARESIAESPAIISETLAKLLEMQKKYDKAIVMYQQLITKYPEKSTIFAAQIDKIKNKK